MEYHDGAAKRLSTTIHGYKGNLRVIMQGLPQEIKAGDSTGRSL